MTHSRLALLLAPRTSWRALVLCICVCALVAAAPATASLATNGDFSTNLSSWSQTGSWQHNDSDGLFDSTSAETSGGGTATLTQCVEFSPIVPGGSIAVLANAKTPFLDTPVSAGLQLFSSDDCTTGPLVSSLDRRETIGAVDAWRFLYTTVASPAGTSSALITLTAEHDARGMATTRFDLISLYHDLVRGGNFNSAAFLDPFYQPSGTWGWVENEGISRPDANSPPLGAAQGTIAANGSIKLGQCLTRATGPLNSFGYSLLRINAGTNWTPGFDGSYDYRITFRFHDAADCLGNQIDVVSPWVEPMADDEWWHFFNVIPIPTDAVSWRMEVELEAGQGVEGETFMVDDLVFAVPNFGIFFDGFENGSTSAWN